jgi:hypothetical protein
MSKTYYQLNVDLIPIKKEYFGTNDEISIPFLYLKDWSDTLSAMTMFSDVIGNKIRIKKPSKYRLDGFSFRRMYTDNLKAVNISDLEDVKLSLATDGQVVNHLAKKLKKVCDMDEDSDTDF